MFRGYVRIMSDRYPIHVRSMSASQADIDTRRSLSNTLRMGYRLPRKRLFSYRNIFMQWFLFAEHFRGFPGQPQVMVGWQVVFNSPEHPLSIQRNFILPGAFEYGSAFVYFIKHGYVNHLGSVINHSVMLGVPTYWREFGSDTKKDETLHRLIKKSDLVMPLFVGRYNEKSYDKFKSLIKKDMEWCSENKVDYVPLCFPGFSWE
ncbi:hypothetical protein EZS27_002506, partial [termite gut metagenome]